jgi:hypothetical protein
MSAREGGVVTICNYCKDSVDLFNHCPDCEGKVKDRSDFRHNVLIRFKADTGEFLAVVTVSTDRKGLRELKNKYNEKYPDFRYEVFWPEKPPSTLPKG